MGKQSNTPPSLPWQTDASVALDDAITRLVSTLKKKKAKKRAAQNEEQDQSPELTRLFKNAEQSRSHATKFMRAVAEAIGHEDPSGHFILAPMKDMSRAREKFQEAARSIKDMGRGRIFLDSVQQYQAFQRLLKSKSKGGVLKNIQTHHVSIADGSITDYLKDPRKSGFSGSINFDLDVDLGRGKTGSFEVQIMPRAYEAIDKISHRLFDMIRILEELPDDYLTDQDKEIRDALILTNQALYLEHGIRSGFASVREDNPPKITAKKLRQATTILDRIWTEIDSTPGRRYAWMEETKKATTEAKTSLMNIHLAQKNKNAAPAYGNI